MEIVKVTGTNFVRDINSMAIINTDRSEKDEYYAKVNMFKLQKQEINSIRSEMNEVKSDISEIKQLLLKLTHKDYHG